MKIHVKNFLNNFREQKLKIKCFDPLPNTALYQNQSGMTLLEIMVTMGILLSLTVAVSSLLRSTLDVKQALARESRINHRLSLASSRIAYDIEHAFITGLNDEHRGGATRRFKTIFKIDKGGETDKLYLSTSGQMPLRKLAKEGDTGYVVYEVRDAKDAPGRKHLYRGYSPLTLDDLKADPPMKLLVRNIKSIKVIPWRGDDWTTDRWDSSRGEWRDRLPQMVKLEIDTWSEDDNVGTEANPIAQSGEPGVVSVKTVVRLQNARFMKEIKQPKTSMRLY